ncbi:MAG: cytochrome c [Myxococcales bacterium]|nr:cytochrome c [Myxococcales bacterium]
MKTWIHTTKQLMILALMGFVLTTSLGACGKSGSQNNTAAGQPSAAAIAEAKSIFENRCVACHGAKGAGDGPTSASLNPKPRALNSAEWQKSVTDDHIRKIIVGGGTAVGLNAIMPPNADLTSKPEVVEALKNYVRGLNESIKRPGK